MFITVTTLVAQGVVSTHGLMNVDGNQIKDKNGNAFSVAGNSIFWSGFETVGAKFYKEEVVDYLTRNWKSGLVRAAMAVEEADGATVQPTSPDFPNDLSRNPEGAGYYNNSAKELKKVETIIDAAIKNDIYVLVDFHTHFAQLFKDDAIEFFTYIARKYGNNEHIIYEIFNEPIGLATNRANGADGASDGQQQATWDNIIRPYSIDIIKAIRAIDPDNLIVVGTPRWSQGVDFAANNPLTREEIGLTGNQKLNVAYTLHFYANQMEHIALREAAQKALDRGLALFVTEWGTVEASGDGAVSESETMKWMKFLKDNNISHANWAISDKFEGASAIKGNASVKGLLSDDLTVSGDFVKCIIENWDNGNFGNCKARKEENNTSTDSPLVPNGVGIKFEVEKPTQLNATTKSRIDFTSPGLSISKFDTEGILTGFRDMESIVVHANGFLPKATYTMQIVYSTPSSGYFVGLLRNGGETDVTQFIEVPSTGSANTYKIITFKGIPFDENLQDITIAFGGNAPSPVNVESFYLANETNPELSNDIFEIDIDDTVQLSPIPVLGNTLLTIKGIESPSESITYNIYDEAGKAVVTNAETINISNEPKIDISQLSIGKYIVHLKIGESNLVRKISKQ